MAKFVAVIILIAALIATSMAYPRAAADNKETLQAENSFGLGYGLYGGGLGLGGLGYGGLGGGLGYGGLGFGGIGHGIGLGGFGYGR